MLFIAILRSIVRNGSLCVIDSAGRRQMIGDSSPQEATLRLTSKASEYTVALNPALSLGEAYMDGRLVRKAASTAFWTWWRATTAPLGVTRG
jgi:cyclopropane-fatty-acyl-phospholipid synthase